MVKKLCKKCKKPMIDRISNRAVYCKPCSRIASDEYDRVYHKKYHREHYKNYGNKP